MMTGQELLQRLMSETFIFPTRQTDQVKIAFLLNLLRDREFSDEQLYDARDALVNTSDRILISRLLGMPLHESPPVPKATADDTTVLPLTYTDGNLKERLVSFLRPDPQMLIEVEKSEIDVDPPITVYQVSIEDGRGGCWRETFATEDLLRVFLRGIRVTFAMSALHKLLPGFGEDESLKFAPKSYVDHLP